jgi:hypothetical protein
MFINCFAMIYILIKLAAFILIKTERKIYMVVQVVRVQLKGKETKLFLKLPASSELKQPK